MSNGLINMDAKERVIKTICHEEPDRVPSYESSIDNLRICKHYRVKYGLLGAIFSHIGDGEFFNSFFFLKRTIGDSMESNDLFSYSETSQICITVSIPAVTWI